MGEWTGKLTHTQSVGLETECRVGIHTGGWTVRWADGLAVGNRMDRWVERRIGGLTCQQTRGQPAGGHVG